jgi:hypothetical protein
MLTKWVDEFKCKINILESFAVTQFPKKSIVPTYLTGNKQLLYDRIFIKKNTLNNN